MEATTAGALVAKYSSVIAGFVGSIMSLTILKDLTRAEALCAIALGFFTSLFTTSFVVSFFNLPSDAESRDGVSFLIGLLAMNIVPAIRTMIKRFYATKGI